MQKTANTIINSRYLKILAVKKDELRDSIVFIDLNDDKYGNFDKAVLHALVQQIEQIEPSGCYFPLTKDVNITFHKIGDFDNQDVIVSVNRPTAEEEVREDFEKQIRALLNRAKSVQIVHDVTIERK